VVAALSLFAAIAALTVGAAVTIGPSCARIAPPGKAGAATGASLAMTYAGVVALPTLFWLIVILGNSYAVAFATAGGLTLWRGCYFFRSDGQAPPDSP